MPYFMPAVPGPQSVLNRGLSVQRGPQHDVVVCTWSFMGSHKWVYKSANMGYGVCRAVGSGDLGESCLPGVCEVPS